MTITAVCTSCGRRVEAPPQFAGKRVKCKGCGTIFQIPSAPAPAPAEEDDQLGVLEQLERTAGGTEIQPPAGSGKGRIGPKLEKTIQANPDAEEFGISGPAPTQARANVMRFRYAGAKQVDQWLALVLLLLGLLGLAGVVRGTKEASDLGWITFTRYAVSVLFYLIIILPITMVMLGKAATQMRYRLPPDPKMRAVGIYTPAFALAACFWFAGSGSGLGLVMGLLFGLALSSGALWLLYRLREEELATSISYGAGGFLLGTGISIGLIIGLNALTLLMVNQTKALAKVPQSPFSPGLGWAAPPAPAPHVKAPAASAAVTVDNPVEAPSSPVVDELQSDKIPFVPVDAVIRPIGSSPIVGILHTVDGFAQVDPFNSELAERAGGTELRVSLENGQTSSSNEYQISPDGKSVAWIAQLPRLSAKVWSFDTSKAEMYVLDRSMGTPKLVGFSSPTTLIIQWDSPDAKALAGPLAGLKPYTIQMLDLNSDTPEDKLVVRPPPSADSRASIAVNLKTQRLAVACVENSVSTLIQYDLRTGAALQKTGIQEVDPSSPAGVAYSADGQQLAVLFEYPGGALLLNYDAKTGKKPQEWVYTVWPPAGISTEPFKTRRESAISWLDSSNLLLYGQGILNIKTGKTIANLGVPGVTAQRVLDENQIELLTDDAKGVKVAKLDREKLNALVNPSATQPTPAP